MYRFWEVSDEENRYGPSWNWQSKRGDNQQMIIQINIIRRRKFMLAADSRNYFVKEAMDDSISFWKRVNENNRKRQDCYGQRIVVGDWIVYKGTEKIFEC